MRRDCVAPDMTDIMDTTRLLAGRTAVIYGAEVGGDDVPGLVG